ncbi:MAG: preprotein translocase subunit SecG [Acidobacteria bacterium]|nr:preprotein translocase subunit SecG [Acidobacteriota bacterium]MBI3422526.1 preprotein translocase subunit SecG [Acidobacteriota bacterium]
MFFLALTLKVIFVLTCVFLILVVLLQSGKGGDVASAFGGAGAQSAFGPRGASKPLEKATVVAAILFMFLALMFSLPGLNGQSSVVREGAAVAVPTPGPASNPAVSPSPAASPEASASPAAGKADAKKADDKKGDNKAAADKTAGAKDAKPAATPDKK